MGGIAGCQGVSVLCALVWVMLVIASVTRAHRVVVRVVSVSKRDRDCPRGIPSTVGPQCVCVCDMHTHCVMLDGMDCLHRVLK